jgi:hypothetical protein
MLFFILALVAQFDKNHSNFRAIFGG